LAEIIIPYRPRPQFIPYHDRKERFAKIVAHRRFGKTVGCINDKIRAALSNTREYPPPRYAYVAPTYTQAKDIAWSYLKHYSAPIPGLKVSESELWVEYPNGARIRLYGADNYDRMRGLYHDGVTIDEPAQMDPRAWPEVIRPTLSDYSGWGTFIGTPAGRDWFYKIDLTEDGSLAPDFFRLVLKADETGIIKPEELESLRSGLTEDQFAREFLCSFDVSIAGAYFALLMMNARSEGRITRVFADPLLPIKLFFDIGGSGRTSDAMAIVVAQFVDQEIRVLDCLTGRAQVLGYYVNELRKRGYQDAAIYLPHDGVNSDIIQGKRLEDHLRDAGFSVEPPVKNQGKGAAMMRVEALRRLMPKILWNEATTEPLREALSFYHEKRDEERNVGLGPDHDWSSHFADATGLMAVVYQEPSKMAAFNRPIQYQNQGVA
jgi:phage terminase large subunit